MINRTLYFENQAYLNAKNNHLFINKPDETACESQKYLTICFYNSAVRSIFLRNQS
jgi:hypothetical protein